MEDPATPAPNQPEKTMEDRVWDLAYAMGRLAGRLESLTATQPPLQSPTITED
jgi:hypothetical protein